LRERDQDMAESEPETDREEFSLVFTKAGSFKIKGTVQDTLARIAEEEWPSFSLADGEQQQVAVRSSDVAAVQRVRGLRGLLGFKP
jgi:hypothetical protein